MVNGMVNVDLYSVIITKVSNIRSFVILNFMKMCAYLLTLEIQGGLIVPFLGVS